MDPEIACHPQAQLLTVKEYADLIRVHRITVYNWIGEGRLEGVQRFDRTIRIDPAKARLTRANTH